MSKSKVAYEKKIEIVRDYLDGRVGYKESIRRANNSTASFRHWVHLYKEKRKRSSGAPAKFQEQHISGRSKAKSGSGIPLW